ncbi:MAG: helix-turn-helix transcriptional regulator [Paracoccaceae bacterium]
MPRGALILGVLVLIQSFCASIFLWHLLAGFFGLAADPLSGGEQETVDVVATIGLVLGAALGAVAVASAVRRADVAERALRSASGAIAEVIEEYFQAWGLTPAEREVAWLAVKGFSLVEIAELRKTSEGTVKAQSNAIYRKAGVTGRSQLVCLFIEDLLSEEGKLAARGRNG